MANVLVVCHGNVNRSPAAAAVIRKHSNHRVLSGGVLPGRRRAAKKMRDAMRTLGYDLEEHRSTQVGPSLLEWADIIVYMDDRNEREMEERMRGLSHTPKMVRLSKYIDKPKIADPCYISSADPRFVGIVNEIVEASLKFCEFNP